MDPKTENQNSSQKSLQQESGAGDSHCELGSGKSW